MTGKHYESRIEFSKEGLHVRLAYERVFTQEEHERMLDYYQHRFSERTGQQVPRDEIKVEPKPGDTIKEETSFLVRRGDAELYIGLPEICEQAPYAFPLLIADLERYKTEHELGKKKLKLIDRAIDGLKEIAGGGS